MQASADIGLVGLAVMGENLALNIADLAEHSTYEEVAYLLLEAELPSEEELRAFKEELGQRKLPSNARALIDGNAAASRQRSRDRDHVVVQGRSSRHDRTVARDEPGTLHDLPRKRRKARDQSPSLPDL